MAPDISSSPRFGYPESTSKALPPTWILICGGLGAIFLLRTTLGLTFEGFLLAAAFFPLLLLTLSWLHIVTFKQPFSAWIGNDSMLYAHPRTAPSAMLWVVFVLYAWIYLTKLSEDYQGIGQGVPIWDYLIFIFGGVPYLLATYGLARFHLRAKERKRFLQFLDILEYMPGSQVYLVKQRHRNLSQDGRTHATVQLFLPKERARKRLALRGICSTGDLVILYNEEVILGVASVAGEIAATSLKTLYLRKQSYSVVAPK